MDDSFRMYVMVDRSRLELPHCAVQAGHAIASLIHNFAQKPSVKQWVQQDQTLIILMGSQAEMSQLTQTSKQVDLQCLAFHEPDMGNARTALAFEPVRADKGKELFKSYSLLR